MIEIRKADQTDKETFEKVINLRYEVLMAVNGLKSDIFDMDFKKTTNEYLHSGNQTTFFATENGVMLGCATVCYITVMPTYDHPTGKRAHVMNVYVREGYRNRGIARQMMNEIVNDATEKGITHISLDATEQGRPLYEKIGFKSTGEGMEMILEK
ncbi:MAG TPA: GNAT family N-acetyltransferase [Clostridiales bacterium]|nr:GNAT family N-acetyltransferase [Clostridiales bacterium]